MNDVEKYRTEYTELGENEVRARLLQGRFDDFKGRIATHWLDELERERSDIAEALDAKLVERSVIATERQAAAAESANRLSKLALAVAVGALAVSVAAFMWSLNG